MVEKNVFKCSIELTDYPYQRDLDHRLSLSHLSAFDVTVLDEVIHHRLKFSVEDLAELLEASAGDVLVSLEKFAKTDLLNLHGNEVEVDKALRKYYKVMIEKFDEDFVPDIRYVRSCLQNVPIEVLPKWYSVSCTSDDIFGSIVETFLSTATVYDRFLKQLQFDEPLLNGIVESVFSAPDFTIRSRDLREKFNLDRETFEKAILYLEFHLVCFLSYRLVEGEWKEVVTPLYEWHQVLRHQRDQNAFPIQDQDQVKPLRDAEFPFVEDMTSALKAAQNGQLVKRDETVPLEILLHIGCTGSKECQEYFHGMLNKLVDLELAFWDRDTLQVTDEGKDWMGKGVQTQALELYRHPLNRPPVSSGSDRLHSERILRCIERSLDSLSGMGWLDLEDYIQSLIIPVRKGDELVLEQRSGSSRYVLPVYGEEEKKVVRDVIGKRLFEVGVIDLGFHRDKLCFRVTPFGTMLIRS